MIHCLQIIDEMLQLSNNWCDVELFKNSGLSKDASILQFIPNCVIISPHDLFTLRNNLSSISAFVNESMLLSPVYVKLPVTVKSPCVFVFPDVFTLNIKGYLFRNLYMNYRLYMLNYL